MKNTEQFIGKKILVVGLAKSGVAAAGLLQRLGAEVVVNDSKPLEGNEEAVELQTQGIEVIGGGHPNDLLDQNFDFIVKNPGIPYSNSLIASAVEQNIPIWTEVELAGILSEAPIIAITGSNGKTTTTTLLYHMLNMANKKPLIAGNIGTVSCTVAEKAHANEVIVLEASSFQLAGTESFVPRIAIFTNLYEAHLDYHGSMQEYLDAKLQVARNQTSEEYLIFNADQKLINEAVESFKSQKVPFTALGKADEGISADEEWIYWLGEPFIEIKHIKLPGRHNLENILSATAAAILSGCEKTAIENVLSSFTGVRHRMQFVREVKSRTIYNDSKATNTLATKSALSSFKMPIILIAGGLDRGHSFEELRPYMKNVRAVVTIGETAERFAEFAKSCGVTETIQASTMQEAVQKAYACSCEDDVILLSPSCASWDQYESFEIRGDQFIDAVMKL
ncbi:UDP-N-acetylmuramoyl-L-alanine--D-glutamate ligase [Sporosarcina sp. P21c]|uniref:UDP-N-acetylmuramoyl-L-alanine--D-glutamate ligase n=1 Tax=unclassified Sporosarcina TaxID=2647733 RepID=UPI000C1734E5|nr:MULTISPECIES: UDP-N-acetylmuramoyl-L-alanine--D-glutamate ligase [unclassified Sporosarcina]PIC68848.1 UDP-N-acetylmuramoyl-L-alanine--D-glutamate ligase [Sporosarcina sp. P16a]PIC84383.1 UDP-N-acetylmuramoyl-L-alanine--D-glutamate ligase [Sporosarcina sp. P1]PIC90034.1 UDP-N-acetylmuramoyl-L-alanine--D-glutamate ligase [Sporosarcina sp. P21c]PIC91596.1 UDP-N-acetylmuramoyl-L-alanine--D-glutamate ligase [Sporosarcina sp. P25]